MSSAFKIGTLKWNIAAFRQIRNSPGVVTELQGIVDQVVAGAGEGYEGDVQTGGARARGGVVTATAEAMYDNARHNTLVREVSKARG